MVNKINGLRLLREGSLMTQRAVAGYAGITVTTLSRIETGKTVPSFTTIRRLADVFKLSPKEMRDIILSSQLPSEEMQSVVVGRE